MRKYHIHLFLIALGIGFYFLSNVQRVAVPGTIFDILQLELNVSAPYITAIGATFMYVYAINNLIAGILIDRYGGIRVLAAGAIVFCIGSVMFPLAHSMWVLYLSRALVGFGAGTFYLSMVKEIKKCFADKDFGIVLSIMMFIGYLGGIIAQAPFVMCVAKIGWRNSMEIFAVAAIILTLLFLPGAKVFRHNPVNEKVHFGLKPFKESFKNKHNINIFLFASINFGLYYVILTVIGKKFLEDFTSMPSAKAALYLSAAAIISSVAGMVVATLSRISGGKKSIFLKICATTCFLVFLMLLLCITFEIKSQILGVLICFLAPGASLSPILIPLIHQTNKYEITGTTVSIMNCLFYFMVGIFGNITGILMDIYKPVSNLKGHLIYSKESYMLVFGFLFILSVIELYNAYKLKDKIMPVLYKCDYMDSGINFGRDSVFVCCKTAHKGGGRPVLAENYDDFDLDKIIELKQKWREQIAKGTPPSECMGCPNINPTKKLKENFDLYFIDINSFVNCNSRCIYCDCWQNDGFKETSLLPKFQEFFKKRILKNIYYGYIQFAGGEPSLMLDFDKIIDLCIENGLENYIVNSNGIKFSQGIKKLLEKTNANLFVSLDSGTKETYEKIKNVTCFDKVVENLTEYAKSQVPQKSCVWSKYIIIPEINDNIEEIDKWYDLSLKIGISALVLDVEREWFKNNGRKITPNMEKMIVHIQKRCKKDKIKLDYYEQLKCLYGIH